ncbi:TPA: hypothetical protein ACGO8L_001670, partial [Streptococcus suis]
FNPSLTTRERGSLRIGYSSPCPEIRKQGSPFDCFSPRLKMRERGKSGVGLGDTCCRKLYFPLPTVTQTVGTLA